MGKIIFTFSVCLLSVSILIAQSKQDKREALFNGKDLTGWNIYLGYPLDSNGQQISNIPIGLNNDTSHVFTVVNLDGENVIRVSGEQVGAISTKKAYADYHVRLWFRWGNRLEKGRKQKDSGLLYHSVGKYGADFGAWMRSQEFQIQEGNCGDYWGCAGAMADVPANFKGEDNYIFDPAGKLYTFNVQDSAVGRHCIKRGDAEHPAGQWNRIDLYCSGDTSLHMVNGKVMMVLYRSAQDDNGTVTPLTKGKLQLQSEGAEIYYKDITIEPITEIPASLLQLSKN